MRNSGKFGLVGCFCLVAAASAFGVAQGAEPLRGNPLWGIPLKLLSATRDRPIFSPSRRPPPPTADTPVAAAVTPPVQPPKPPERPLLSLVGTIVDGDDGFAIFIDQNTNASLRIRMGADYQGWMLSHIEARSVTLQKGQDVAVLSFPKPTSNPSAAAGTGLAALAPAAPPPPQASTARMAPHYLSPESNALPPRPRRMSAGRH